MRNYNKALQILNGNTVIAHDRRAPSASRIDFTSRVVRMGRKVFRVVRTAYGISNRTHNALAKLATKVDVVDGRFLYYYNA